MEQRTQAPLLFLHTLWDNNENLILLENDLRPPYKKPVLPFGRKSATAHRFLRELKVSQALMMENLLLLRELLSPKIQNPGLLYSLELEDFDADYQAQWKRWLQSERPLAPIVSGLILRHGDKFDYVPYDDTPFDHPKLNDTIEYSELELMQPLISAISFYNAIVEELFLNEFLIYPAYFAIKDEDYLYLHLSKEKVMAF